MVGSIKSHTKNFKFIIPEFNVATWHDYIEENFRSIDALFQNLFGINGFSGMWKTNTAYEAGQVLFVGEDGGSIYEGRLVKVIQNTNTGGFATFSEAIEANPKDYEFFTDASSAQLFANLAKDWASKIGSTVKTPEGDDTGEYSAKHYQTLAKGNEEQCEMYKNLTDTNVQLTQEAAIFAETSAQNSETSAQNALVSEQNSKLSETNSKTSEQNALVSEQNAKSSENNAKTSEETATNTVEVLTNNFNTYNNQLLSTTSAGVSEITNTKTSSIVELNNKTSSALSEINSKTNVLDKTMITNCLTNIPQDIKLELNNGTLTLKTGSKVYVPNGFVAGGVTPKFDEIIFNVDMVATPKTNGSYLLYAQTNNTLGYRFKDSCYSGTSDPATAATTYYDTSINKLTAHNSNGDFQASFPIAEFTVSNGAISSIDQVFNGFGYIGSTVFALPGVKGLIPNGRNEDGTLNSTTVTIQSVQTTQRADTFDPAFLVIIRDGTLGIYRNNIYDEEKNYNRDIAGLIQYVCRAGSFALTSGVISNFNPKTTFHALDYNNNHCVIESYRNGSNWYRVYSDGWVEQGGQKGGIGNNSDVTVTLLKSMKDVSYSIVIGQKMGVDVAYRNQGVIVAGSMSTTGFKLSNRRFSSDMSSSIDIIWEVRGMGA